MIENLCYLLGGAFVAWNVPQPPWARKAQEWATAKLAAGMAKIW